jgi:hypothetical protein
VSADGAALLFVHLGDSVMAADAGDDWREDEEDDELDDCDL